jgi:PAS domain S-box-containing protein
MNRLLRNLSLQRKLAVLTMLATVVALLFAGITLFIYEQNGFRNGMVRELSATARITGLNSAAALSFDDPKSAEQTLQSFSANGQIIAAYIYRSDGKPFARYQRPGQKAPPTPPAIQHNTHRFTDDWAELFDDGFSDDWLEVFQDIMVGDEKVGTICIVHDLSALAERVRRYVLIFLGVMGGASMVALLVIRRLQRVITAPILHLAETMREVAANRNYSLRAEKQTNDELGQLSDGFNEMLKQIQDRDGALEDARDGLEKRVQERTQALEEEVAERARMESERDRFFTLSLDLLCIGGFDGYFKRLNPAFEGLLDIKAEQLLAEPFLDFIHPEDQAAMLAQLEHLAEGKRMENFENRYQRSDGSYVWISWSATPVQKEGLFYAYGRDVTERKRAEEEMKRLHRELVDISHQAGMAEVATSVLHNIGNVLNSVNVTCTLVAEKVRKFRIGNVAKIAQVLRLNAHDLGGFFSNDPMGQKLPDFTWKLGERLAEDQKVVLEELSQLASNIDHIKEIVTVQQAYAKNPGGIRETLPVAALMEDALRMNEAALSRHHVEVVRDYGDDVPPVCLEKHKVLQILLNLVSNAKYAVTDNGREEKELHIKISRNTDHVAVSLTDNGVGISAENMTRIFAYGFTTKRNGHGFGLHSGVLAAKEMGGQLRVMSDGPGKGATFTLELPLIAPANN